MMDIKYRTVSRRSTWPRVRKVLAKYGQFLLMVFIAMIVLYPILLMLFTGLKSKPELVSNPFGPPRTWMFENMGVAWEKANFGQNIKNSAIVSISVVVGTVFFSLLGGFAYARLSFPGKRLSFLLLALGLVIPQGTLIIPLFTMMRVFGLLGSFLAVIIPQIALGLPFGILLLRGFISGIPSDLFDAAEVDGCNIWQGFRYIIIPLVSPAAVALAVFQFIWSWNQYLLPLVMIQDPSKRTVPLALGNFIGKYSSDFVGLAAASVIAFLPALIVYVIFRRQIMETQLKGAIKG